MDPREEQIPAPGRSAGSDRSSADEMAEMKAGFAKRLKEAFDGASNATIARRLNTPDATIHNYVEAKRLPVFEMLFEISRVTGVNLHWLITGNGEKRMVKATDLFTGDEEREILDMALRSGRTYNEQIHVLAMAAAEMLRKVS